jgi:hypothetical protein
VDSAQPSRVEAKVKRGSFGRKAQEETMRSNQAMKPVSSRAIQNMLLRLALAVVTAFCGMFLPLAAQNKHNVVWESLYGLGFYLAGFFARGYAGNRFVGLVGLLVWPLFASGIVFLLTRHVMRSSSKATIIVGILFAASLLACVSDNTENYLSSHGAPLYWNLYATFY